jgi:hypothetical protein
MGETILRYTQLRPGDARITWRSDMNGVTFIACPASTLRTMIKLIFCCMLMCPLVLAISFIEWKTMSFWGIVAVSALLGAMFLALTALGAQAILAMKATPRLRVDHTGAMLIVPDLFWMNKQRFAKDELRFAIAMSGVELNGRALYRLSLKKPSWVSGRPVFAGYSKAELEAVVKTATMILDGAETSSPPQCPLD